MTKLIHHYGGWVKQAADERDWLYTTSAAARRPALPLKQTLRDSPNNGPVLNQGQLGTCVANSNADMYRFVLSADALSVFLPSRLYIYAKGREMEGTPLSEDSGMQVRDALKVLAAGAPPETDFPYSDANPGPFQQEPPAVADADAAKSHAVMYLLINPNATGAPLRSCIAEGYPFTFGFQVPQQLESSQMASGQNKLLNLPISDRDDIGGHGVECIGYDFSCTTFPMPVFEIKNSWDVDWCDQGYFFMDYRFFRDGIATDVQTIRTAVES